MRCIAAITPRTKGIFLCSPNNPTGNSWTVAELERVLAPGFAGRRRPGVRGVRLRTLVRAAGRAPPEPDRGQDDVQGIRPGGLRVGYLMADPALVDLLLRLRIPFSISLVAARACLAAVVDPAILEERRVYISTERDRVFAGLQATARTDAVPVRGQLHPDGCRPTGRTSTEIAEFAKREGLLLLRAVTSHGLGSGHVRVTVGTREENDMFLDILRPRRRATEPLRGTAATGA